MVFCAPRRRIDFHDASLLGVGYIWAEGRRRRMSGVRCAAGSKDYDLTAGEYDDEVREIEFSRGMSVRP